MRQFLGEVKQRGLGAGNFLGLLNVLIGRRIAHDDGTLVSHGLSYRELAAHLKRVALGARRRARAGRRPASLPPRDRERYWYQAIVQAHVDSPEATAAGDRLAKQLRAVGYDVGPAPGRDTGPERKRQEGPGPSLALWAGDAESSSWHWSYLIRSGRMRAARTVEESGPCQPHPSTSSSPTPARSAMSVAAIPSRTPSRARPSSRPG